MSPICKAPPETMLKQLEKNTVWREKVLGLSRQQAPPRSDAVQLVKFEDEREKEEAFEYNAPPLWVAEQFWKRQLFKEREVGDEDGTAR